MTSRMGFAPEYLTVGDISDLLRVSTKTVTRAIHNGTLPATKVARHWRIRVADYDAWINPGSPHEEN